MLSQANPLPRHMPCHSILLADKRDLRVKSCSSLYPQWKEDRNVYVPNFSQPDMDVLIFNTVPKQSENLIVDFLKKKKKKPCYTPSCPAGPASSISCPLWF